jgi:hypothetical protein
VYINKDSLFECFDVIQNENCWNDISIRESLGLARLLNDDIFLYFLSFLFSFVACGHFVQHPEKVSSNAVSVCKAIQHFEVEINDIRGSMPQVFDNSEHSKMCAKGSQHMLKGTKRVI